MMSKWNWLSALLCLVACYAIAPGAALSQDAGRISYSAEMISDRLNQPTGFAHAQDDLLYIMERGGQIRILQDGEIRRSPFIDLSDLVSSGASIEQGLLGLAFDPQYPDNGYFYVSYSDADFQVRLERYQVSRYRYAALPGSRETLLTIPQATPLHKGGHLRFGPDGYLYMSVGDGELSEQPSSSGQDLQDLRGKILRLDIGGALPYQIPPNNPFVAAARVRPEIWLLGFRNPWHFSFAPGSRAMYITDVGWSSWEEINYLSADSSGGENFGWRIYEGEQLVEPGSAQPAAGELQFPVFAYPHLKPLGYDGSIPVGCAIIGGFVYRGEALPELRGRYIFSDFCHGELWSLLRHAEGWAVEKLYETGLQITALGEDAAGDVYFADLGGQLGKLIHAPKSDADDDGLPNEQDNCPSVANPDQADHWGAMGIGDACDQAFYFAKRDRSEVKMFQQHYGAYHFYACRAGNCGLLAVVDPAALGEDPVLRLVNEELGWSLEAAFAAESAGRRIYAVSIFAEDGGIFADDLQLLLAGADLSWRTAS